MLAGGGEAPEPVRTAHPDVAALVAFHPVDESALCEVAVSDVRGEHAAVRDRPVRLDVEDADVRVRRIVDVEERLVGREAQPVRLAEVIDEELRVAASRRNPVDASEVELALSLAAEAGQAT